MTVAKLIEQLQLQPADVPVVFIRSIDHAFETFPISTIIIDRVYRSGPIQSICLSYGNMSQISMSLVDLLQKL